MTNPLQNSNPGSRQKMFAMLAVLVTAIAVVRICASYHSLNVTWDETGHLACGMQWIDEGKYTIETLHPPLGRVAIAALPYISGSRSQGDTNIWIEGNKILNEGNNYWRTLTLARLGILPFFILSVFLLWSWTKRLYGDEVALLSVLFFTLLPPVLAHAGLATTDYPLTAALLASCYALWWWIQSPTRNHSLVLGVVLGLSVATKFSFLVFFPVAAIIIAGYELYYVRKLVINGSLVRKAAGPVSLAFLSGIIILWASYRFSFGPLSHSSGASYPMPEFFDGLSLIFNKNSGGTALYFMGNAMHNHGSVWFFPVALALKTPIAFLLLALVGIAMIFYRKKNVGTTDSIVSSTWLPLLISAGMLAVVIPSNINLGVRHILPIYPFLAMLAGIGAVRIASFSRTYGTVGLTLLIAWMALSSFSAGNDRIAYFNEIASSNPEHYLIDSDLDWGQDLNKLADTLHAQNIQFVSLAYNGSADLAHAGLPKFEWLQPITAPNGNWVAISLLPLYVNDGYKWLRSQRPSEKIGNSILLYHFTDGELQKIRYKVDLENVAILEKIAANTPTSVNFLNLSSAYHKAKRYSDCIAAARKSLQLQPDYAAAYNNISAGFLGLSEWDSAIAAATEGEKLSPDMQVLKDNLSSAIDGKKSEEQKIENLEKVASEAPTAENYINLSAAYYDASRYEESISTARKALALNPDVAAAYNNICASNNKLGRYEEAKKAGEEAVRLAPSNMMFQLNLNVSIEGLQKK